MPLSKIGREVEFVEKERADEWRCNICLDVMIDPTDTGCGNGHLFCHKCIENVATSRNSRLRTFPCPICRQKCSLRKLHKSAFIERKIKRLIVRCPNHRPIMEEEMQQRKNCNTRYNLRSRSKARKNCNNSASGYDHARSRSRSRDREQKSKSDGAGLECCDWTGAWCDLDTHLTRCPFESIKCMQCKLIFRRKYIKQHENRCPFTYCNACRLLVKKTDLAAHRKLCPEKKVKCGSCGVFLQRKALKAHYHNECLYRVINCVFSPYGCNVRMRRNNHENHLENSVNEHLVLVKSRCDKMQIQIDGLIARTDMMEKEREQHNRPPPITQTTVPRRVRIRQPVVSLIEDDSDSESDSDDIPLSFGFFLPGNNGSGLLHRRLVERMNGCLQ